MIKREILSSFLFLMCDEIQFHGIYNIVLIMRRTQFEEILAKGEFD